MIQLLQVRSNTHLSLDDIDKKFKPMLDVVIVGVEPSYSVKKDIIHREQKINDVRFSTDEKGVDELIRVLTIMKANMRSFSAITEDINSKIQITKVDEQK